MWEQLGGQCLPDFEPRPSRGERVAASFRQLLRAHDVYDTVQARNVWRGLRDAALTDFGGLAEDG